MLQAGFIGSGNTAQIIARVIPTGGGGFVPTIIDSLNRSNFLKTAGGIPVNRMLAAGSVSMTIPLNTNAATSAVVFGTAFGAAPAGMACAVDSANNNIVGSTNSVTANGFTARAWWSDGAATRAAATVTFYYVAIGAQ